MKNWLRIFLFTLVVLAPGSTALAEISIVDSLEWMAVDAPLIVRGKVTNLEDTKGPGSAVYRDLTLAVEETLKGKIQDQGNDELDGKELKIRLPLWGDDTTGAQWHQSGHSYLFFLRLGVAEQDKALAGRWVLRENRQSVIDLAHPQRVYTADFKYATNAPAILQTVREWVAKRLAHGYVGEPNIYKPQRGYLRLDIPVGSEIFRTVYAGSACYLNVPVDEKYRSFAMAKAQSKEYYERAVGAAMLRNFPGPETIPLLNTLLADPGEAKGQSGRGELARVSYPVRKRAYESLVALGEKPEMPLIERPPTEAVQRAAREEYWKNSMREVLPRDWGVTSIRAVLEPEGWMRTKGSDGLAIECRSLTVAKQDQKSSSNQPVCTLYVMPKDWEGVTRMGRGEALRDGVYTAPLPVKSGEQALPAQYLGHDDSNSYDVRHFFIVLSANSGWENASERLTRYFGLSTGR